MAGYLQQVCGESEVKKFSLLIVALLALPVLSACSEIAAPDAVGLYYAQGQSDGNKFDHCMKPGQVDDAVWNNSVYYVPNNVRTWNVAPSGGDTNQALVVTAKPDAGQQSGLEVLVYTQTNFKLNTYCGTDDKDPNSPVVQWWQNLGDRYDADTQQGWLNMLNNTVVPALEKAKNTTRYGYLQSIRTAQARATMLGTYTVKFNDPNLINTRVAGFDAVTREDVRRVAKQYLQTKNRTVIVTNPAPPAAATPGA